LPAPRVFIPTITPYGTGVYGKQPADLLNFFQLTPFLMLAVWPLIGYREPNRVGYLSDPLAETSADQFEHHGLVVFCRGSAFGIMEEGFLWRRFTPGNRAARTAASAARGSFHGL
jgi:hypothetical protein